MIVAVALVAFGAVGVAGVEADFIADDLQGVGYKIGDIHRRQRGEVIAVEGVNPIRAIGESEGREVIVNVFQPSVERHIAIGGVRRGGIEATRVVIAAAGRWRWRWGRR